MSRNVCSMTVRSRVTSTASSLSDRLVRQPLWQNTRERVDDLDAWLSYPASSFVLIAGEVDEAIPKEALQISLQVEPGVNNNKGTSQDSASVPRREPKKVRAGLLDWWRRYLSSSTECTMVAVIGGKITVYAPRQAACMCEHVHELSRLHRYHALCHHRNNHCHGIVSFCPSCNIPILPQEKIPHHAIDWRGVTS